MALNTHTRRTATHVKLGTVRNALCVGWVACTLLFCPLAVGASEISFEADGGGRTVVSATGGMFSHTTDAVFFGPFADFALWTPPGMAAENPDGSWNFSFPGGILALSNVEGGASSFPYPVDASDIGTIPSLVGVIPVLPFSFSLTPPHADSTWDIWPPPPRPVASLVDLINLTLGPGTLRGDIAAMLGVDPHTLGGDATWIVDDFLHNPTPADCAFDPALGSDDSLHCGVNNNLSGRITVQEVPEPLSVALIGLGIGAFAARRRAVR